jgi:hypothetical protein
VNQTIVTYNPCGGSKTTPLYQYDYGQELVFEGFDLPSSFEVQFSNEFQGESTTQIATDNICTIPDAYLLSGDNVYAWIFLHTGEDDGETTYYIEIPVMQRAEPTDVQPDPVEQDVITQTIAALNSAVSDAESYANSAESAKEAILNTGLLSEDDGAGNVTVYLGGV